MTRYAERFADALTDALPFGFTVSADDALVVAGYGTAALVGFTPNGDRRAAVTGDDTAAWIDSAVRKLRSQIAHYTPEAREAAEAMLATLATLARADA